MKLFQVNNMHIYSCLFFILFSKIDKVQSHKLTVDLAQADVKEWKQQQ